MLVPVNTSTMTKPLMPMSEVIVSFGFIAGGLIFMESCSPVLHLMEYYGYSPMFSFNITLGVVTLIMAWEMSVFTIRDRLSKPSKNFSAV